MVRDYGIVAEGKNERIYFTIQIMKQLPLMQT